MSSFLSKDDLFANPDVLAKEQVDLKTSTGEVRGHVFVREMTAEEKDNWETSLRKEVPVIGGSRGGAKTEIVMNLKSFRAKLAACTVCDEEGNLMFDMHPRTLTQLSKTLSATNMEAIADVASRLNKITPEDQEALLKNSGAEQINDSNSDSAEN